MKTRIWMSITAIGLFAALAIPIRVAGQEERKQHDHYRLVDVGTLGGPASYFSADFVGAQTLNNRGIATSYADTTIPDPYAPNCANHDCFVSHAVRWQNGILTDLGALPGVNSSFVTEINARGWIVGGSENSLIDPVTGLPENRAILWKDGEMINLGTLGGTVSFAVGINNRGQVTGHSSNTIPDPFSLDGFPTETRGFIWENGVMQDLGTLGGPDAVPFTHPNRRGQVSGGSYTNSTPNPDNGPFCVPNVPTLAPFLWDKGTMINLGTLGGTCGQAEGVNNRGQVIGQSNLAGNLRFHPFIWDRGVLTDLGTLGGDNGSPSWINDAGQVVGEADLPGSLTHDAFLWNKGVMTDLGNLGQTSLAFAINSDGQVVGSSRANDGTLHAFLWENGGPMIDLNAFVPPGSSLQQLTHAVDINDRGEIYGVGVPPGVAPQDVEVFGHVFLLIPCGGDNADEEDCQNGDEGGAVATQTLPSPAGQTSTAAAPGNVTSETLAGIRARLGRRFPYRGLGVRPPK